LDSYKVEQAFYTGGFAVQAVAAKATVPKCLMSLDWNAAAKEVKGTLKKAKGKKRKNNNNNSACPYLGSAPRFFSVLEDLSVSLPVTAEDLTFQQATAALDWCASFHATFVGLNGAACSSSNCPNRNHDQLRGLWQVGGFWSLDRKEGMLRTMEKTYSDELRSRVYKELPSLKVDHSALGAEEESVLLTNYYQKFKMRSGKKSLPSLQEFLVLFDVAFLD
ncbi:hypothetical protein TrST_g11075, partial [Triparma strigata]